MSRKSKTDAAASQSGKSWEISQINYDDVYKMTKMKDGTDTCCLLMNDGTIMHVDDSYQNVWLAFYQSGFKTIQATIKWKRGYDGR